MPNHIDDVYIECAPQSTTATSAPCENLVNRWWRKKHRVCIQMLL